MEELEEDKGLKVTLAARVIPELKDGIVREAEKWGLTPSAYIETVLLDKVNNTDKFDEIDKKLAALAQTDIKLSDLVEETQEEVEDIAEEVQELEEEVEEISEEVEEIKPIESTEQNPNLEESANVTAVCEAFEAQIKSLKAEQLEAENQLSEVIEERDALFEKLNGLGDNNTTAIVNFDEATLEAFNLKVDYIKESEPFQDKSTEDVIMAALESGIYHTEENPLGMALWRFIPKK